MPRLLPENEAQRHVLPVFPVPVYIRPVVDDAEFNLDLVRKIEALRDDDQKGVEICKREYRVGYTSFFSRNQIHQEPGFAEIASHILRHGRAFARAVGYAIDDPPLSCNLMFGTINVTGSSHELHRHRNSLISGTYYVSADKASSKISFLDPKAGFRMHEPGGFAAQTPFSALEFSVQPRSGLLVMFPSYLEHSVAVHQGTQPRVGITFNLDLIDPARVPGKAAAPQY
ncbi:MAG: TIGR02466 family protein [Gammaproteobacteria bacterium]